MVLQYSSSKVGVRASRGLRGGELLLRAQLSVTPGELLLRAQRSESGAIAVATCNLTTMW